SAINAAVHIKSIRLRRLACGADLDYGRPAIVQRGRTARRRADKRAGRPGRRESVKETGVRNSAFGADKLGFKNLAAVHWNLTEAPLYEHALQRREAILTDGGALTADTGVHTGRSPKDKFIVADAMTENTVWWDANGRLTPQQFDLLLADFIAHVEGKEL